jgi:hypothetical protein
MRLFDKGSPLFLLLALALKGRAGHGHDQLAPFLLLLPVAFHRLPVHLLDQLAAVLAHGTSSLAGQYT